ncbi:DUF4169 family protein [Thalassospira marina]|uniref:DUF4169 domain-containing protein n=1 Tax=Thalassospira marina TaxID=2048283 RepID=A0ABN5FBV3_9PROT|nr:DUF4169 family protein [Thalassospira marina]AUG51798.1 hypothetical protein CSC3H3_03020 [Thalassospira marina]
MADIVNLRQHRKRKARDEKAKKADANRTEFGRTRAERRQTKALQDIEDRKIDAHRLQPERDKADKVASKEDNPAVADPEKGERQAGLDAGNTADGDVALSDATSLAGDDLAASSRKPTKAEFLTERTSAGEDAKGKAARKKQPDGASNVVHLKPRSPDK